MPGLPGSCVQQFEPCPKLSTVVNTASNDTTVTNSCCWTDVLLLQGTILSIMVDAIEVFIPIGTAGAMQAYLNGLGIGTWTVVPGSLPSRFTFCVTGSNSYGVMNAKSNNIDRFIDPTCSSATVIIVTNISIETCDCVGCTSVSETTTTTSNATSSSQQCCWSYPIPDGTTSVTIVINGTTYSIPLGSGPDVTDYLNGLNSGVWTVSALGNGARLCVVGNATYGNVTVNRPAGPIVVSPLCGIDSTLVTFNTTITTCKCVPTVIPPVPEPNCDPVCIFPTPIPCLPAIGVSAVGAK
jgi:hypothetical protein